MSRAGFDRRALGLLLTRLTDAPIAEVLAARAHLAQPERPTRRIALTGPPGAGKSTLTAHLTRFRLACGAAETIGVLAVDPTSPLSGGSILGDRIRIDALLDDPRLFVRSVPSRDDHDGLSDNILDLIVALEHVGIAEVVIETVVGQSDVAVRNIADTVVALVLPGSGDVIQAMKAGLLEIADIVVVTKADTSDASRVATELAAAMTRRGAWAVPILTTSSTDSASIAALSGAIDAHGRYLSGTMDLDELRREHRRDDVIRLFSRHVREAAAGLPPSTWDLPFCEAYASVETAIQPFAPQASPASHADIPGSATGHNQPAQS